MFPPSVRHSSDLAVSRPVIPLRDVTARAPANEPAPELKPRVTLRDIAKDASVSRATVSLVLRDMPVVAKKTREKVLRSMSRLGYVYAELLVDRIGHADRPCRKLILRPRLIVRESCGPFFSESSIASFTNDR